MGHLGAITVPDADGRSPFRVRISATNSFCSPSSTLPVLAKAFLKSGMPLDESVRTKLVRTLTERTPLVTRPIREARRIPTKPNTRPGVRRSVTFRRMPSSAMGLLTCAGLTLHETCTWGKKPTLSVPGLYIVSTSPDPTSIDGPTECSLSEQRIGALLAVRPEIAVNGTPANATRLTEALGRMWPAGETVVYVGLASTSVAHRVRQYYTTRLGARAPHAGGWPIKVLDALDHLHVHVAAADHPDQAETTVLRQFMAGVAPEAKTALSDPSLPLPFANLELSKGNRKRHGITGAKAARSAPRLSTRRAPGERPNSQQVFAAPSGQAAALPKGAEVMSYTLNVTQADIAAGQVRVTREPKRALGLPSVKTTLSVSLRGEKVTVPWDPRLGPDKERSGLIRLGKGNMVRLLGEASTIIIEKDATGLLVLY